MDEQIFIPTEAHSGHCSHCRTEVHIEATKCPGCGAFWGFSNGMTRNEFYHTSKDNFKMGVWYVLIMASFLGLAALGYHIMAIPFAFGLLFSINFLLDGLIIGFINKRKARNIGNGGVDWWLKS
jgi:hypothetical protein